MSRKDAVKQSLDALENSVSTLPRFRSFKTAHLISYCDRWHHDLLIQLTLDINITKIERGHALSPKGSLSLIIQSSGQSRSLIAVRDHALDQIDAPDGHLILGRSAVLSEPSLSNARAIWSTRKVPVSPGDRLRVLERLEDHPDGLAISQLTDCIRSSTIDAIDAILALACLGLLTADLGTPLDPHTIIRSSYRPANADMLPTALSDSDLR